MCVAITMAPGVELTEKEVEAMHDSNKDGFGLAWAKEGRIYWYKTTTYNHEAWTELISRWSEYPRLCHFRLSTAGSVIPELCHPFEVSPTARCAASLVTGDAILIHNGHWHQWEQVKKEVEKQGLLPDPGPWSDSRLASFLAYYDKDWLDALGGKVAIMNPKGEIRRNSGWQEYRTGLWVSNTSWNYKNHYNNNYSTGSSYSGGWRAGGKWDQNLQKFVYDSDDTCAMIKKGPVSEESRSLLTHKNFSERTDALAKTRAEKKAEKKAKRKVEREREREVLSKDSGKLIHFNPQINSKPWVNPKDGKVYQIQRGELVELSDDDFLNEYYGGSE